MTDTSNPNPSAPAPAFPPMPKNAAGALGFLSNYFGGRNPGALAGDALILFILRAIVDYVVILTIKWGWLSGIFGIVSDVFYGAGLICLVCAGARFIAGCCRRD